MTNRKDSVVIGQVSGNVGDRSVVIGPMDDRGNVVLNQPMTIGPNAHTDPASIALGADACAGARLQIRWDETWHRLLEWTNGQGPSERLAAQILLASGFTDVDPSHPLGGKDGGKDAVCLRNGERWVMAVYFPRGQQQFEIILTKLHDDAEGARRNAAVGIAFVTNQEVRLAERNDMRQAVGGLGFELFHLEKITAILDQPAMHPIRKQFLSIESSAGAIARITDKWVSFEYVRKAGITEKTEAEGYRLCWVSANQEAEYIECDGWEYVEVLQDNGTRMHLKVHDAPINGGYLVVLKKKN